MVRIMTIAMTAAVLNFLCPGRNVNANRNRD
jgi:hypothetical protein